MIKNLISIAFLLGTLFSFGQQGKSITLDEVINTAKIIPIIYIENSAYSFKDRDLFLKKMLTSDFWWSFKFSIPLEEYETKEKSNFSNSGPLRVFINDNELNKRHLFKSSRSIRALISKIDKVVIKKVGEDMIISITAQLDSGILYNRLSSKGKSSYKTEQAGSIALEAIEVVQKTNNDGLFYSPTYINGELTFEKNDRLAELYEKAKKFKKMGLNEWGIDVDANNWFTALRAFIGAKAVRATSDGIPILFNSITFGDTLLPLWVVDGVYLSQAPISVTALTPFIREVKVLKYAEASEYGSRGAAGVIVINTSIGIQQNSLNKKRSYLVKGKKNKKLMINYQEFEKQFKLKIEQLKVEKKYALEHDNKVRLDSFQRLINSTLTKSYLYTINFVIKNSDYEIAPYLAYTKVSDANILLLDSIAGSLSKRAKRSIYGKKFIALLKERKAEN